MATNFQHEWRDANTRTCVRVRGKGVLRVIQNVYKKRKAWNVLIRSKIQRDVQS